MLSVGLIRFWLAKRVVLLSLSFLAIIGTYTVCYAQLDTPKQATMMSVSVENQQKFQALVKNKPPSIINELKPLTIYPETLMDRSYLFDSLTFSNYRFESVVDLSLSTVKGNANFQITEFNRSANFAGMNVLKNSYFAWAKFKDYVNFAYLRSRGGADFYRTQFDGVSNFYMAHFMGSTHFNFALFNNKAHFSRSTFFNNVYFQGVLFKESVYFTNADFNHNSSFENTVFNKDANFDYANFNNTADFSHANFLGHVSFDQTSLPKYMDFSYVNTKEIIDLTLASPNDFGLTKINLIGTDVYKFKFNQTMFKLYFPKGTTDSTIDSIYENLLISLNKQGFSDDYRKVATEFYEYKYIRDNHRIINLIDKYWWNYGFDKPRIFLWILIFLLFFSIINTFFYDKLVDSSFRVPFMKNMHHKCPYRHGTILHYLYHFPRSLLYTTYLFFGRVFGFILDEENFISKNLFIVLYVLVNIAVGLSCAFFVLNIIFK